MNDGLQQLVVLLSTLADLGQVGQNVWQQILVVLGETVKLALSTFDLLLDMDPDRDRDRDGQTETDKDRERQRQSSVSTGWKPAVLTRNMVSRTSIQLCTPHRQAEQKWRRSICK